MIASCEREQPPISISAWEGSPTPPRTRPTQHTAVMMVVSISRRGAAGGGVAAAAPRKKKKSPLEKTAEEAQRQVRRTTAAEVLEEAHSRTTALTASRVLPPPPRTGLGALVDMMPYAGQGAAFELLHSHPSQNYRAVVGRWEYHNDVRREYHATPRARYLAPPALGQRYEHTLRNKRTCARMNWIRNYQS